MGNRERQIQAEFTRLKSQGKDPIKILRRALDERREELRRQIEKRK